MKTASKRGLAALGDVRQALRERERQAAERAAQEKAARAAAERAKRQFADAVGPVTPMPPSDLAALKVERPAPEPRQRMLDEQAALKEALSDEVDEATAIFKVSNTPPKQAGSLTPSKPKRCNFCANIPGGATSASWKIASSAP